uniref:BamA/TamA family outer membrane protein n=1 Tax=Petrachloros mirabilis TaxID=2918835 RepID=UPI003084424A
MTQAKQQSLLKQPLVLSLTLSALTTLTAALPVKGETTVPLRTVAQIDAEVSRNGSESLASAQTERLAQTFDFEPSPEPAPVFPLPGTQPPPTAPPTLDFEPPPPTEPEPEESEDADADSDAPAPALEDDDLEVTPPSESPSDLQLPEETEPGVPPEIPPTAPPPATPPPAPEAETQVLVSEVLVEGATGELEQIVYEAISTRPGQTTTRTRLQSDINAIFATGFFRGVRADPSDTPLGVRVTFSVQPNPDLRAVQIAGNEVLTQATVDEIFSPQYGRILNLRELQEGIQRINEFYQEEGFILGQVVGSPQVDTDGTVTLQVAEGVIEDIEVRFQTDEGEPARGRTRPFILTREMVTQPGDVLNQNRLQTDLQRVFALGLFEDVQVGLEPGQDPRKVVISLNVQERRTGSFSAGAGFSSNSGFFGTGSFTQNNVGGNNQRLNTQVQVGTRELLFDVSFTDPWIGGDPFGTSYTVNLFNRLTLPLVFDGGTGNCAEVGVPCEVRLPPRDPINDPANKDRPRVNRLGGGVVFSRPLTRDIEQRPRAWTVSVGAQYQRISIRDANFRLSPQDELGNDLSFSGTGNDDLFTVQVGVGRDLRNDPLRPTRGSALRLGIEQSAPIGQGSIAMTRVRGSYSHFIPVNLIRLTEGPQTLAFNVQAGTVLGDLPPYEAFSLGGSNSIRGYGEGDVGSGRSFVQATVEYRFPIFQFLGGIGGVLFVDAGSTLGTQDNVPGSPGILRGKPGAGIGYGVGLRVNTPIGPVRIDYALNDEGDNRFHFGFGERF